MCDELHRKASGVSTIGRQYVNKAPPQNNVYVVDDDSSVRQALLYAMKTAGFEVRPFASGVDFLSSLEILSPGCVLLDLKMPEISGLEVLSRLGEQIRRFPCIAITGYGDLRTAVDAMKLGAADFLEKPFTDEALLSALDAVFLTLHDDVQLETAHARAAKLVENLSRREQETLQGLVAGMSNKALAHEMGISVRTVEMHRKNLMDRLCVRSVAEATHLAIAAGLKPL